MARRYDFTRFVKATVITGKTIDDELNIVDVSTYADGFISKEDAIKAIAKEYGIVKKVNLKYTACMYGITTETLIEYGTELNPVTRLPWDSTLTEEQRNNIVLQYIKDNS